MYSIENKFHIFSTPEHLEHLHNRIHFLSSIDVRRKLELERGFFEARERARERSKRKNELTRNERGEGKREGVEKGVNLLTIPRGVVPSIPPVDRGHNANTVASIKVRNTWRIKSASPSKTTSTT